MDFGLFSLFLILAALLALQSIISLRDGYRFLGLVRHCLTTPPADYSPPAAIIIPCKGLDGDLEQNATRFLAQDYPDYQVVFVVAAEQDPAHPYLVERLRAAQREGPGKASLVVAGLSDLRGEKVNNLLQGLTMVDSRCEVLVFADVDARPKPDWLRSLISALADPGVTVSTGFRWYLPGRTFVSQLRAAWDTSIATMLRQQSPFAWGGSMALRVEDFRRLQVAERYWARTVSDDYAVTRAVHEAGGRIRFEPRCFMASRDESGFRDFVGWANRQIIVTRVYAARLWGLGLASHTLYCATFLLGLLLLIDPACAGRQRIAVAASLLLIAMLGMAKGRLRSVAAAEIFPEESAALRSYGSRYWQLAPLVPWMMLYNFTLAGVRRRIEWRGTHYILKSANEVRVIRQGAP